MGELGYTPNFSARSLRVKRTQLVALLGSQPAHISVPTVEASIGRAAAAALNRAGFDVCTNFLAPGRANFAVPPWRVDRCLARDANNRANVRTRHMNNTVANLLFLDGHVENKKANDLKHVLFSVNPE